MPICISDAMITRPHQSNRHQLLAYQTADADSPTLVSVAGCHRTDHRPREIGPSRGENYLKGKDGDRLNAILAACGYNMRNLLKAFLFLPILLCLLQRLITIIHRTFWRRMWLKTALVA